MKAQGKFFAVKNYTVTEEPFMDISSGLAVLKYRIAPITRVTVSAMGCANTSPYIPITLFKIIRRGIKKPACRITDKNRDCFHLPMD